MSTTEMPDADGELAAFRAKAAHTEWVVLHGKIHTMKQLHAQPPLKYIPDHILRLLLQYRAGEISRKERNRWYNARRKLRLFSLIDEPPAKRIRSVSNADSCRRWRQKRGKGFCKTTINTTPKRAEVPSRVSRSHPPQPAPVASVAPQKTK